jgi:hypothetical protein
MMIFHQVLQFLGDICEWNETIWSSYAACTEVDTQLPEMVLQVNDGLSIVRFFKKVQEIIDIGRRHNVVTKQDTLLSVPCLIQTSLLLSISCCRMPCRIISNIIVWFFSKLNILGNVTKTFKNGLFSRLLASDHPKGDLHLTLSIYGQVNKFIMK